MPDQTPQWVVDSRDVPPSVASTSSPHPEVWALVQAATAQTIVYLDRHSGSDSNLGNSPGAALATINAAVNLLNLGGLGGVIKYSSVQPGPYVATAPIHAVVPILIDGVTPFFNSGIDRGFGTPNSRSMWDGVTTANGTTITSATGAFGAPDVNRVIEVYGAGTGGGTYYDFISSVTDASHVVVANGAGTAIARPAAGDLSTIRVRVYGDWNRVVTDAAITSGQSVITSATAAWTAADVGTEVVIGGAGHGGQALRATIKSVQSATQATIVGKAAATVAAARCVIGLISGDLITWHVPNCGLKNLALTDSTTGAGRIGAAWKYVVDDGYGSSTGQHIGLDVAITNSDPAGAWEHDFEEDGSWNQAGGGGGIRKCTHRGCLFFGTRQPGETLRINNGVHQYFSTGGNQGAAPLASTAQGIVVLDPGHTGTGTTTGCSDQHFAGWEGIDCLFYTESQYTTFVGGRLGWTGTRPASRSASIQLGPTADHCYVACPNIDPSATAQLDAGTNNVILTDRNVNALIMDAGSQAGGYHLAPDCAMFRTFKVVMTGSSLTVNQPLNAPAARKGTVIYIYITNSTGGALTVAWSGAYKQSYTPPANTKSNMVAFQFDGANWIQFAAQGPDF